MISNQEELLVPEGRNIKDTAAILRIEINLHPRTSSMKVPYQEGHGGLTLNYAIALKQDK
jgi:hypothetical protein